MTAASTKGAALPAESPSSARPRRKVFPLIVVALVALLAPQVRQFGSLADARPMDSDDEPRGFETALYPKVLPPP